MRASSRWLITLLFVASTGVACTPPDWENDAHEGVQAARAGEYEKAERLIESALDVGVPAGMAARQQGELLGWLGWLQSQYEDQAASIPTLERAIRVLRESVGGRTAATQQAVRRLAQVHSNLGNLERAEQGFRDGMEITASTAPSNSAERSGAINDLAYILARRGKLEEARKLAQDEIARIQRYRPRDAGSLGSLMQIAANIERLEGRYDEAEVRYREAIEIQKDDPTMRAQTAEAYAGLGTCYVQQGRSEEAERVFSEATALLAGTGPRDIALRSRIETEYPEFARAR